MDLLLPLYRFGCSRMQGSSAFYVMAVTGGSYGPNPESRVFGVPTSVLLLVLDRLHSKLQSYPTQATLESGGQC